MQNPINTAYIKEKQSFFVYIFNATANTAQYYLQSPRNSSYIHDKNISHILVKANK